MRPTVSDESIFLAALEMPVEDRAPFLDAACSDDAGRRQRVERLLSAHPKVGDFMERPVVPGFHSRSQADQSRASASSSVNQLIGTIIGPYKLLEQIGEGGFGVVFMAEQQHPVRRKVALKV